MKKRIPAIIILAAMLLSIGSCGSSGGDKSTGGSAQQPGTSQGAASSQGSGSTGDSSGYTFRTSADNKVVTENGTFTKDSIEYPVLITSIGQSADVSMLDALMKKVGADYTFNTTASADDVANYKTVIIACGASSKGLGAAGISQEDELARANAIAQTVKDNGITVIVAHLGGASRRGALSDQFNDIALGVANYVMVVEEGNDDGKFTDAATDKGVPITLLHSIADAITPLTELFGA